LKWKRIRVKFRDRKEFLVFAALIGALVIIHWVISIQRHI
jgi:hypothetical protein